MNEPSEPNAEKTLDPSVKEAVSGVLDNAPPPAATDVLEARLGEVLARYEKDFNSMLQRYHSVLNQVEVQVEPLEARIARIRNTKFSGDQVIELMAQYEKASGIEPRLTPTQIIDLFKPYLTGTGKQNGG